MVGKRALRQAKSHRVFGQRGKSAKVVRAGLYARVSTHDQQTLPLQNRALRDYVARRGWAAALQIQEVGSGASQREMREKLLDAARRREIDVVLVWRLDRWGPLGYRSTGDSTRTHSSWGRVRIVDRCAGSDHTYGASHGRAAGRLCRVRTRDSSRTGARRPS
jgi:predicted site-specific integrase-resolvase